jgi:hypothetical protein
MRTQVRFAVILATILAMALAYLGGTFVSAQINPLLPGPRAPALTQPQWVALEAASSLLLLEGEGDAPTYLPLVMKR